MGQCKFCIRIFKYLNSCSMRLGNNFYNRGHESSKQGLVFASISHGVKFQSIIKSNPINSKLCYFLFGSSSEYVAYTASKVIYFIFFKVFFKKLYFFLRYLASKYFWKSSQEILLPFSCFPYAYDFFCTASFVKCTIISFVSFRLN